MRIYLDKSLESIKVFGDLLKLLEGVVSDPKLMSSIGEISDIYKVSHVNDPVQEFLDYYLTDSKLDWSDERKFYVLNALYAVKGSVAIFDVIRETFLIDIEYTYNYPILELVNFKGVTVSNLNNFVTKFKNALYYLVYYTQLTIHFEELILTINDDLNVFLSVLNSGYRIHEVTLDQPI